MEDLKILSAEIEAERKLLGGIVDSISSFVEIYQSVKTTINELKGTNDFNFKEAVDNINHSLTKTQEALSEYDEKLEKSKNASSNIDNQLDNLQTNLKETNDIVVNLNSKLQDFLKTQTNALASIAKLDDCISNIKKIDFSGLDKKLSTYSERIESLNKVIDEDVKERIEENSKQISKIETNINKLMEKLSESDISTLLREIQTTNALITETQKEKFALNQELDVEFNSWADRNGVKRKRK